MTDLVAELKAAGSELHNRAADEITKLRAQVESMVSLVGAVSVGDALSEIKGKLAAKGYKQVHPDDAKFVEELKT